MENSSLGEFSTRLELVVTFQMEMLAAGIVILFIIICLLNNYVSIPGRYSVSDVLGNVHLYYSQYSDCVLTAINKMTATIIKEFRV